VRTVFRLAGYVGLTLVVLVLLAYLARDPLRDTLAQTVSTRLSKLLNGSLEIGKLRGSFLTSLVLQNVVLRDQHGIVVQLEGVRLFYNPLTLLKRRLTVSALEIIRPHVTLVQDAEGRWNVSRLLPPASPDAPPKSPAAGSGWPFAVVLAQAQLHDGHLTLQSPSLPGVQHIEGLQVRLSGQVDRQGLQVTLQQLQARATPADVAIRLLSGSLQRLPDAWHLEALHLETEHTVLTANGVLPGGQRPASLALLLKPLDVGEIGRLVQNPALHGLAHLTLDAAGPPGALAVHTQLSAADSRVDLQGSINMLTKPLRYNGTLMLSHVDLAAFVERPAWQSDLNLHLQLDGQGVAAQELLGQLHLDIQPSHLGHIALHPSQIHMEAQPHRFVVHHFELDTTVARMSMSGAVDTEGRSELQYQLAADLSHLQPLLGTEAVAGEVQMHGQVEGERTAISAHGTLQAGHLHYQTHRLEALTLTYEGSDLGAQPQATARVVVQQVRLGTLPIKQVEAQATYQGTARQVHFTVDVQQSPTQSGKTRGILTLAGNSQRVTLTELQLRLADRIWYTAAPVEATFSPGQVHLQQFRLVHANEAIELSGALDGHHLQDLRLQAAHLDLAALRRLMPLPDLMQGEATLQVHLTGTLAAPVLQGELTLQPEMSPRLPQQRLHTTVAYEQGQLQSDTYLQQADREVLALSLRLPIDLALTKLSLEQRLREEPVVMRVDLKRPDLSALRHWHPELSGLSGTVQGELALQGTYAALDLDANLQFQQFGVQGSLTGGSAPLRLTASLITAASVSDLARRLSQSDLALDIQQLRLQVPSLHAQLPGTPPQPLQIQHLLLQAAGQLTGDGVHATLHSLHLQGSGLGLPRTNLSLAARLSPRQFEVTGLQVRWPHSDVRGNGTLVIANRQLQGHVDFLPLRLDDLIRTWPANLPREVRGVLKIQGSLPAPQLTARLQYADAQVAAEVTAQLQEQAPHYTAALRLEALPVASVLPGMQGRLQAQVQLQGTGFTGAQRRADLDVRLQANDFPPLPGLTAQLHASLAGEAIRLDTLRLHSTPVALEASGTLSAAQQATLNYTLTLGDLRSLQGFLGFAPQAQGRLTGKAQGALAALQTSGILQLDNWSVADWHGRNLRVEFSATNLFTAPQATIKARLPEVQRQAPPSSALSVHATYQSQQATFTVAATAGPYEKTALAGNMVFQDGWRLTLDRLRLQHQALAWENVKPIEVRRDPQGTLHLPQLLLRQGEQEISLQGMLTATGTVSAQAQIQRVQVQPIVHTIAPNAAIPDGQLHIDLTLRGTLQQPQLDGKLALTSVRWQKREVGDIHVLLATAGATLRTELRWHDQTQELLHIHGTLGMGAAGALAMQVRAANVNIAKLPPFSAAIVQSGGRLQLDLQLTGALRQPLVHGILELRDGFLQLVATGERYKDIQAQLRFAGQRVEVQRLHIGSRSGTLQLHGWLECAGLALQQLGLALQADNFTAMHTPNIEAIVSGTMAVYGSLQDMSATGKLTIPHARYRLTGKLGGGPADVEPWELTVAGVYGPGPGAAAGLYGQPTAAQKRVPLPFLRTDLMVDIPRNAWVQGTGMAIEVRGSMHVAKALEQPFMLDGSIETVRGFANYYGKKFVLQEGKVTFTGEEEINPFLDVTVTHTVSDYTVSIYVGGKARQPKLTLTSTPELPQEEIVSLLVTGKTTERLSSAERSALPGQAQQVVGGVAAGELEKVIGKPLGLDTIEIEAGEKLGTGKVGVGRYVTQDLFLSYEREVGGQESNKVGVEYSINRSLKLKGSSSDTGEFALDFLWRLDY
jgi:autotransporter translocation and assembly factor TamB